MLMVTIVRRARLRGLAGVRSSSDSSYDVGEEEQGHTSSSSEESSDRRAAFRLQAEPNSRFSLF